jgi:hypothetical protein
MEQLKIDIPVVVQVIVPVSSSQLPFLATCLEMLKRCTAIGHVVNLVIGNSHLEGRIGEIIATARSVYDRSGLVITTCNPDLGYNGAVMEALRSSDFQYTAVLPANCRLEDAEWFGKMQLPLVRSPNCGMTIAGDGAYNTRSAFRMERENEAKTKFFMLARNAIGVARAMPLDLDGDDIANAIRLALLSVGATTWCVPSCRLLEVEACWS